MSEIDLAQQDVTSELTYFDTVVSTSASSGAIVFSSAVSNSLKKFSIDLIYSVVIVSVVNNILFAPVIISYVYIKYLCFK